MANSISSINVFVPLTKIKSAEVNSNTTNIIQHSEMWQKYTIPYTTFVAKGAVAAGTVTACTIDSDEIVSGFYAKHSTPFTGGVISAATFRAGVAGDTSKYVDDFDVFQAAGNTTFSLISLLNMENTATTLLVTLSLTGGNLSGLSAGSVDIYVKKSRLPS